MVNFLLMGPLLVGIPLLAHQRLPGRATAFGVLMAAFAIGNLAGYAVAAGLPRPGGHLMRRLIIGLVAAFGISIGLVGILTSTWADAALLGLLGLGNGFMAVILVTWMQTRTPPTMTGRMMSLMMLATTGLVPLSEALAGVVSRHSLTTLFVAPGTLVLSLAALLAVPPTLRLLGNELSAPTDEAHSGLRYDRRRSHSSVGFRLRKVTAVMTASPARPGRCPAPVGPGSRATIGGGAGEGRLIGVGWRRWR